MEAFSDELRRAAMACAYVCVEDANGEAIGSAFHLGDGYYATARHVLDGRSVRAIGAYSDGWLLESELREPKPLLHGKRRSSDRVESVYSLCHRELSVDAGPYFHRDSDVDVAIIHVGGLDIQTPYIELPAFLDDAIGPLDFLLSRSVVMGYPPIAFTLEPALVVASGEINAVADTRLDRYVRFLVSATPRGGFSGGPLIAPGGWSLGLITQDLRRTDEAGESGFMAALSADAIIDCLHHHGIKVPAQQTVD